MWVEDILILGTLGPLDLGTLGPWDSWTSSLLQHLLILPLTSSYLLQSLPPTLLLWNGLVMGGGLWVVTLEDEIGDGPLTFILILKSCWVGRWNPGTSSFLLYSLPLTSSHHLLIPPSYSTLLPNLPITPPTSSRRISDDYWVHTWRDFNLIVLRKVFWWVGDIAIIASSSRSRSLIRDLR